MVDIAVLASGRGSNLQSIIDSVESGFIPKSRIVTVISDKKDAYALERARKHNIEALFINPKDYKSREEYDMRILKELKERNVGLVLLAGYMRILSPKLVNEFKNRMMNIHPALLPSFPGLHAQKQALDHGAKLSGCTVHFVDSEVDHGPIILQSAVPVLEGDTEETLSKRILEQEHIIYSHAVKWFVEGKLKVKGRRVTVAGVRQAGRVLQAL
ncbi:MAG: phosphoribosylglycinamide formyltransferase [Candidatus Altiarchaeota archaeon]